jgi:spermidine synthase
MAGRILLLGVLLFASGCCALVYQSVWLRSLRTVFGASTPSTAAVLAVWMGGLGLGALWLGERAQRTANPLRMYALLELGIALTAAISPFLLMAASAIYVAIGGTSTLGEWGATLVRLLLTPLVFGVPAVLLGGTLPAAGRAVTDTRDVGRKGLALLYGVNALGAVAGVLLATFLLFEAWGMRSTLWAACLVNCAVALAAWLFAKHLPAGPAEPPQPEPSSEESTLGAEGSVSRAWLLAAAFATGFSFLLMELVWYRMAGPILGGSTYTFGLVLAVALLGIGSGGLVYAWWGPTKATAGLFAVTCSLEALAILIPLILGDDLALLAEMVRFHSKTFAGLTLGWAAVTTVLVFPAALVAGFQFPLLLALKGVGDEDVATDVGEVYAANTLGSILGSLAGGFGLLPLLTAPGAWRACALGLLPVGAFFAFRSRSRQPAYALAFLLLCGLTVAGALAPGPGHFWRHSGIGAGRSEISAAKSWNERRASQFDRSRYLFQEIEGRESSLAFRGDDSLQLVVNGKTDGSAIHDAQTQILLGLLGSIVHPDPRTAFVIGLGTGQTAGWLAEVESMERVEVAEIEPGVVEFARQCGLSNHNVVAHPKVKILIADGREALQTSANRFDLIVSEPSNPYRAGLAGFYSVDFYRQAKARLAEGGIFSQWIQAYELHAETILLAMATLRSVFPHVTLWRAAAQGDLLLMATLEPQVVDLERVAKRLPQKPYRTGMGKIAGIYELEGFLALHSANHRLADKALEMLAGQLNTDDRNLLEYRFARSVGRPVGVSHREIREAAEEAQAKSPSVAGTYDEKRRGLLGARLHQASGEKIPSFPTAYAKRLELWRALSFEDFGSARRLLRGLSPPPKHDLLERLLLIEIPARLPGNVATRRVVFRELDELAKGGYKAEAACLRLQAAIVDKAHESVGPLARSALDLARVDPWITKALFRRTLRMLQERVRKPPVAKQVCEQLLRGPFALRNLESSRLSIALTLSSVAKDGTLLARVLGALEPFPIWKRWPLEQRARLYAEAGSDLSDRAARDLELFLSYEGQRMKSLLESSAKTR